MKQRMLAILLVLLTVILTACGEEETEPFTIGVIPAQTEGSMEGAMDKLQTTLTEALDREVSVEVYPDYNGVVEAMNYDNINMAYFGPLTYVVAHEKSGAKAIITQLIDGEPFYYSYVITHTDNPWNSMEDLLDNSSDVDFAFGDPNSTSGSLIPSIELQDRGVYTSEDEHAFNSVRYTGSHDATALAVQNQQVDAGAIDSAIYNQLVESGKIDGDQLKIIWESDQLFQYPWAVHKDTDQETIEKLQEAFLAIEDEEIWDAFGATGFTTATDADYESIKEAAIRQGIIEE
ncbi:phosphate/phosphite/phosphonate ABC transporter substrate-binding protein [Aquibacillus koreensis]|uniref:Phosphate/phosphite/phosphonate ABC transporter substrate-binding protein n=1 Tax=Aquibacillus koreensis TaxID=279446 RepID=A0A9X4AHZ4_9BACI|nr:phosphate/phosphite/phosphonate ABC transporter substrate-binding protein [Aquibacillus koreensis]MCT2536005.1 phosphate/phosphite/phosphonate ABC transporter substrate-binding protein [Aquibacillus koreensis]MDC3420461.1 phosphate/phosphite/phosphonate ABC transporter substrate-binding protein [Aquibacillus koreensis]